MASVIRKILCIHGHVDFLDFMTLPEGYAQIQKKKIGILKSYIVAIDVFTHTFAQIKV